jgi:hypothetical protein
MGTGLALIGGLLAFAGWIWIVVIAFQDSVGWGIGSLLIPLVALIYGCMNSDVAKNPLIMMGAGVVLQIAGAAIGR